MYRLGKFAHLDASSKWNGKSQLVKPSHFPDFPGGPVVKNSSANAADVGWPLVQEDPACLRAIKPLHQN